MNNDFLAAPQDDAYKKKNDISPDWYGITVKEQKLIMHLCSKAHSATAIRYFNKHRHQFSNYWFWHELGCLWLACLETDDLPLWRKLFTSDRPNRATSIMKPSELAAYKALPDYIEVYRPNFAEEEDWLNYTLSYQVSEAMSRRISATTMSKFRIKKEDAIALFTRRGADEIICLDKGKADVISLINVSITMNG